MMFINLVEMIRKCLACINDLPHFQNWKARSDQKMLDLHNDVHKTDINDQKMFGLRSVLQYFQNWEARSD